MSAEMEEWSSSGMDESERDSSTSHDEDDEEPEDEEEPDTEGLCRELVQVLCSERVGQITKTYHDIEAVTHLLEEKERDLELAARIGQSLLKQNKALTERNKLLDEHLEIAKEEIAQLRHELSMRDDLLHFYASTEDIEHASETLLIRNDSSSSLSNYVNYDFLQQKLKGLEEENFKLRTEANELTFETSNYEEQEQQLMMVCVDELTTANKQVVSLSEELARKVEDSLRQQEEISTLLGQIVDLEQRCKGLTTENEELTQHLNASRESQSQLKTELKELQERYSECEDMLHEAREDIKNLRNKSLPNSTVQRYSTLASVVPMDSLAAEIEGTFRKGLDSPAPTEYKNHPLRVFETVKVANQVARLRSQIQSPQVLGSSPASLRSSRISTPRTSCYESDNISVNMEDKHSPPTHTQDHGFLESKRLGQPGTPGGQDLEEALRSLSERQESHTSERPFFDVERERKLRALQSGSSGSADGSSSVTLHQWQQLAKPNLGGILHPRPGVLTKDFRELDVDFQHVYSLNDLEEDEPDLSKFPNLLNGTVGSVGTGSLYSYKTALHKVHSLEKANKKLELQIKEFYDNKRPMQSKDLSAYYKTISELRAQINSRFVENAGLRLKLDNIKLAAEDFHLKYETEMNLRMVVEADTARLRGVLGEIKLSIGDLENQLTGLKEELQYLKKNHEEDLLLLREQHSGSVNVEMDCASPADLNKELEEMRAQYEMLIEKNRKEAERWFQSKAETLQTQVTSSYKEIQTSQTEITDLKRTYQSLEIELQGVLTMKQNLEASLADVGMRYSGQLSQLQLRIDHLQQELQKINANIQQQATEYQLLLDIKMRLEMEIAEYRRLLEGEAHTTVISRSESSMTKTVKETETVTTKMMEIEEEEVHNPHLQRRVKVIVEELVDGKVISSSVEENVQEVS
ncbi:trafficking kinesin-binding 1-like isoform X2 [Labeo rohita]|uniref:Trafficking kinesin-binding 1-like isoform X2 n=1 Tax=Labeo rohita TaxID=84645 RepID=A0A498LCW3_LABRO|nr:trafficking kinesin-binding 1-like isoform X2 [Labeo rohita]